MLKKVAYIDTFLLADTDNYTRYICWAGLGLSGYKGVRLAHLPASIRPDYSHGPKNRAQIQPNVGLTGLFRP